MRTTVAVLGLTLCSVISVHGQAHQQDREELARAAIAAVTSTHYEDAFSDRLVKVDLSALGTAADLDERVVRALLAR
jgi:hypothetical protein